MRHAVAAVLALGTLLLPRPALGATTVAQDLAKANEQGQTVLLVVTERNVRGTDQAGQLAADVAQRAPRCVPVLLDRGDPANADLVAKFRLASVELPLILVVASNGVPVAGAKPGQVTVERLVEMVPSAGKGAHMKALSEGKADFLVFARADSKGRAEALAAASQAVATLRGAAAVTVVDVEEASEARFLAEMEVNVRGTLPLTIVVNAKGQRTETFEGVVTAEALVAAAGKQVNECCPGGKCKH